MWSRKEEIKKSINIIQAYREVFETEAGQMVLIDLMKRCYINKPVTNVSVGKDSMMATAFFDGKRSAVLDIFKMIGADEVRLIELFNKVERDE